MLHTYHGTVNKDGTISLLEQVELPEGFEVFVVLDNDSYIESVERPMAAGYSEERLRAEIEEGKYWARVFKDLSIVIARVPIHSNLTRIG